ncbi:MAG: hypothetical protein K5872_20785 [Rhizobiaceae bacterium]|nr:hypothetical protein [Rhizobiaceae bacterium]MCV0408655.1 hypothetical protein [Rhizobiaceae bacterium]
MRFAKQRASNVGFTPWAALSRQSEALAPGRWIARCSYFVHLVAARWLTREQNTNTIPTSRDTGDIAMPDIVQDVVSLVTVSLFVVTLAAWVGAL